MGLSSLKDLHSIALLFDFYGPLLTQRQQELVRSYYLEDLSLAEIAGEGGISRQAVHDLVKRSEAALHDYEERLGFVREHQQRAGQLIQLEAALQAKDLPQAIALLQELRSG